MEFIFFVFLEVMDLIKLGGQVLPHPILLGMSFLNDQTPQPCVVPSADEGKAAFQCVVSDEFLNHFPCVL